MELPEVFESMLSRHACLIAASLSILCLSSPLPAPSDADMRTSVKRFTQVLAAVETADLNSIVACLRTVATGRSWMEDSVFRDSIRAELIPDRNRQPTNSGEQQVLELVEQGCKNKEIALELAIRPGTVKIHLKHIFEKTGVRGRYGLAITGLKEKGMVSLAN